MEEQLLYDVKKVFEHLTDVVGSDIMRSWCRGECGDPTGFYFCSKEYCLDEKIKDINSKLKGC